MRLSRRAFIHRSSAMAAASILPIGCSDSSDYSQRNSGGAIIIGSGFAGSVAALRLAEAGIRSTVLERGRKWTVEGSDTFPTTAALDKRANWTIPPAGTRPKGTAYAGLLETISGPNVSAVCGACVGGGSLVYGGVLIQPPKDTFESVFPYLSYDAMDNIYYPRVIAQIGASPIPDDVLSSPNYSAQRTFIRDAEAAGYTALKPAASFDWDVIRREIAGEIPAAASVGEYPFGCNSGAKQSTDKNYLKLAVASGLAEVRSLTEVEMITERSPRGYTVTCRSITADGELLERYTLEADYLFMAAGSMNTTKLLLKSQQSGELNGANQQIGQQWGTNGDQLLAQLHPNIGATPQGGPACIAAEDRSNARHPVTFMHSPLALGTLQLQLAMSVPDESGRLSYDAIDDTVQINWNTDTATPSAMARQTSFNRLLAKNGGTEVPFIEGQIWHPLGGAVMEAACDEIGQLYGYRDLFVIDGSLLPGSAATVNPALTVAANAERVMEALIPSL